jgi:hypothetical protein
LGRALAVFQAFSLAKPRIQGLLSQKLKFWESLYDFSYNAMYFEIYQGDCMGMSHNYAKAEFPRLSRLRAPSW